MKSFILAFFLSVVILAVTYKNNHVVSEDSQFVSELYSNSTEIIRVDTNFYFLETFLCRNLIDRGKTTSRSNLVALIYLVNAGNLQISTNISITNLYFIKDQNVWISAPVDSTKSNTREFRLTKASSDGPEWDTGVQVDVIAEIKDNSTNIKYLLIARNQYFQEL